MPSISPISRPQRLRLFASEYVKNGFQAQKAVLSAGFTKNPASAAVIANRLLNDVNWLNTVEVAMQDNKMSADEVLERLTKVARSDADLKGSDVVKANELLGKFHKLFVDKIEQTSTVTTIDPSSIQRSIDRICAKTSANPRDVALNLQQEWSDQSDPDYNPELYQAIQEIVNSMPVEQIVEQISEIAGEQ